ncbi:MAG TPA: RNA methyltransferase, partial [Myxococcales bacterium]|nr:RNA methyltransferase [Myxococcales bacterium]
PPEEPLAPELLLSLLRERARALLLASDFLNPQQPDLVLDELVSLARRARPTQREVELLLAAVAQLQRTRRA